MRVKAGFAICGSFCTFARIPAILEALSETYEITPILSEAAANTDTRFAKAAAFMAQVEQICQRPVIRSIAEAEPIGPQKLFDVLIVAPCTGNTLSKLATGMTDTSVTMACKAHLRNQRPLVIGVSTNDGLSGGAANLGTLLARKHVYFVPFRQDDPTGKPASLVADFDRIGETTEQALLGKQLQPLLL